MRLQLFTFSGFAVLSFGLVSGCAGGQTGDLSGNHPGGNGNETSGGCDEHKQLLGGFDETTDQGTASELLAYAEGTFEAPISWKADAGQAWTVGPESGSGTVHVDIVRGASAYELTYTQSADNGGVDIAAICPPAALGVEAHVTVTTDGGALAESFDTLLRSSTASVATFSVPLDLQKLSGSLEVSFSDPKAKLVQPRLQATLTAQGMTGSLSGIQQVMSGSGASSAVSASSLLLAVWPDAAACRATTRDGDGLAVGLDQSVLGVTGEATLASLVPAGPASVTWLDGSRAKLDVQIESTGDGCFSVDQLPLELDGGPKVGYPVTITLKSDDGRLDGSYAGLVQVTGTGSQRRVKANAALSLAVDDIARSGFTEVQVPSDAESLLLQITSERADGVTSGSVSLLALSSPPCDSTPMELPGGGIGVPGCAGQSRTPLETASWGE